MIEGVIISELKAHPDERGYFREVLRNTSLTPEEAIGQISHSLVYTGVIKAWHSHVYQTQWNYVVNGLIYVALHDVREESPTKGETMTFLVGDNQKTFFYKFPPGVLHGYKCLNGPMNIIYITSGIYDLQDEVRIEHNDPKIGFDWLNLFKIK